MAQSIQSLFGLTPQEAEQNIYKTSSRAEDVFRGIGSLFGYENETIKRSKTVDTAIQDVLSKVTPEEANDPSILYPMLAEGFKQYGLGRESLIASQTAQEKIGDYEYKKNQIQNENYKALKSELEVNALKAEEVGMIANGFLTAYDKATDDTTKNKVWNNSLTTLKNKGVDTTIASELPTDQRSVYLQSLVDSSENSTTRFKNTKLAVEMDFKNRKLQEDAAFTEKKLELIDKRINLMATIQREGIASKEGIAASNALNGIDKQLKALDISSSLKSQAEASSKIGTRESDMNTRKYLSETVGLDNKDIPKALLDYNNVLKSYLDERDMDSKSPNYLKPKYSPIEASNMTQKLIESKVGKEKTWGGLGSKTTYSNTPTTITKETTVSTETPPVNLLKEGANTAFDNGQVWSLKDGKPIRVK
jgi:hypothetical protein